MCHQTNISMIVIATSEVNRGGYRLLAEGIDISNYENNPILLFHHNRPQSFLPKDEQLLPVGRIENLRMEGGKLVADEPIWDEKDDFALKLKQKYEDGFLNAFSPGIIPLTISDDPDLLLSNQVRPTVATSELFEISITDVPKDGAAVRLHLSADQDESEILPLLKNDEEMNLENIALKLGLDKNADEQTILQSIDNMHTEAVENVIELGVQRGVVNENNKSMYLKLAAADLDTTKDLILSEKPVTPEDDEEEDDTFLKNKKEDHLTLTEIIKQAQGGGNRSDEDNKDNWDYLTWSQKDADGLNEMRKNDPEKYTKLAEEYAGK